MKPQHLNNPILIAAWPGMGHVALTASYYMIAKLQMEVLAEYASSELFDVDHVSVSDGRIQPFRYPKNQIFVWRHPNGGNDLLVFIGEAQPPLGRYNFCRKLIDLAQREGVSKVFTFAAMAAPIGLEDDSRVIAAATDQGTLDQLTKNGVDLLASGSISGMNGIILGVAAERNIPGGCMLGEMPHNFINVPYPKASLAILNLFSQIADIKIELGDLKLEAERMQDYLTNAVKQIQRLEQQRESVNHEEEETFIPDPILNGKLSDEEKERLERLFEKAQKDRSKAFELKQELDRLDVFKDYEDRFLDLFKKDNDG